MSFQSPFRIVLDAPMPGPFGPQAVREVPVERTVVVEGAASFEQWSKADAIDGLHGPGTGDTRKLEYRGKEVLDDDRSRLEGVRPHDRRPSHNHGLMRMTVVG